MRLRVKMAFTVRDVLDAEDGVPSPLTVGERLTWLARTLCEGMGDETAVAILGDDDPHVRLSLPFLEIDVEGDSFSLPKEKYDGKTHPAIVFLKERREQIEVAIQAWEEAERLCQKAD